MGKTLSLPLISILNPPDPHHSTILLVDDDPDLIERVRHSFRSSSGQFELLTARNGAEALPLLESRTIDLLVIDLQMPLMDGFELLTYALPLQPDAHLILLSEVPTELPEVIPDTPGIVELVEKLLVFLAGCDYASFFPAP